MANTLSQRRPELNNHPICPFVETYKDRIHVKEASQRPIIEIDQTAQLMVPLRLMAVVIAFPKNRIETIRKAADEVLEQNDDLDILINDKDLRGDYRGVFTGYTRSHLVIVQHRSHLNRARNQLKKSGYYEKR